MSSAQKVSVEFTYNVLLLVKILKTRKYEDKVVQKLPKVQALIAKFCFS